MIQTRMFTCGKIRLELVAGVGADPHEGAGAERQKAGISRQQVEPDRAQRQDEERDHHGVDQELVAERRDDDEGDEEDQRQAVAVLADREDRHVGRIGRLVLAGFAVEHVTAPERAVAATRNPLDDLLPEQALRAEQKEGERDQIGEPALDPAAEQRPPVELAELLADADDEAADDRAGNRGQAAEDQHRQRLQRDDLQRERHVRARAPEYSGRQRHDAGGEPDDDPDLVQRDADRQRRLMVVGDGAQRPADARLLEEKASPATMTSAIAAAAMSSFCNCTLPPRMCRSIAPSGRQSSLVIIDFGLPPNTSSPKPMRK